MAVGFAPEVQTKQFVAEVNGAFGFRFRVFTTGSDRHYFFVCVQNPDFHFPVEKSHLTPEARAALAHGYGHAPRPGADYSPRFKSGRSAVISNNDDITPAWQNGYTYAKNLHTKHGYDAGQIRDYADAYTRQLFESAEDRAEYDAGISAYLHLAFVKGQVS